MRSNMDLRLQNPPGKDGMFQVVLRMIFLTQFYSNGLLQRTLREIHNASQATAEWPPSTLWLWTARGLAWGSGGCSYPLSSSSQCKRSSIDHIASRFQHEISSTLPTTETVAVQIAASKLCSRMGEPFEDKHHAAELSMNVLVVFSRRERQIASWNLTRPAIMARLIGVFEKLIYR